MILKIFPRESIEDLRTRMGRLPGRTREFGWKVALISLNPAAEQLKQG